MFPTNTDMTSAFRQAIMDEERGRNGLPRHFPRSQSQEELDKELLERKMKYRFETYFEYVTEHTSSPIRLICIPTTLAFHDFIGSNAAMRLLMAPTPSRSADVDEWCSAFNDVMFPPSLKNVARRFAYTNTKENFTFGECCWLLRLCEWLGCAEKHFSNQIKKVITRANSLSEIDFRKEFEIDLIDGQEANLFDRLLHHCAQQQYQVLENLLKRSS